MVLILLFYINFVKDGEIGSRIFFIWFNILFLKLILYYFIVIKFV